MTRLTLSPLLLATGVSAAPSLPPTQPENVIQIERDQSRGVTCYILNGVGISCVPDSQLKNEQAEPHRYRPKPTQAPARWADERYSM